MAEQYDPQKVRALISRASIYAEYVGGLGDAILRMYFSGKEWYGPLEKIGPNSYAVVSLMCHNLHLAEVFKWHPKKDRIHVFDFGFTTPFHPWENAEWRVAHGLPMETLCPPNAPSESLTFYPSPEDLLVLSELKSKPYIIMAATAGTPDKTIPELLREAAARRAVERGFQVVVVGRSIYLKREGRARELEASDGILDATDRLSVPGMIEAVKVAAGVISSDTSVLHAAWQQHRPVFLLYNRWCLKNLVSRGPVGYMQGIDRPDTDHMEFSAFTLGRLDKWLERR